jgi:hypothetical protein
MATAAYSCDRTMVALHPRLGVGGGGGTVAAFERHLIQNYVLLFVC